MKHHCSLVSHPHVTAVCLVRAHRGETTRYKRKEENKKEERQKTTTSLTSHLNKQIIKQMKMLMKDKAWKKESNKKNMDLPRHKKVSGFKINSSRHRDLCVTVHLKTTELTKERHL